MKMFFEIYLIRRGGKILNEPRVVSIAQTSASVFDRLSYWLYDTCTSNKFRTILKCVKKGLSVRAIAQRFLELTGRIKVGRNDVSEC